MLTALSVARECHMIGAKDGVVLITARKHLQHISNATEPSPAGASALHSAEADGGDSLVLQMDFKTEDGRELTFIPHSVSLSSFSVSLQYYFHSHSVPSSRNKNMITLNFLFLQIIPR